MALGDTTPFNQSIADRGNSVHNFGSDTFKLALVTTLPTAADSDPRWGVGGGTDLSANECTPGGNYTSGGIALSGVTYTQTGGVATFVSNQVTILADPSNPTNARAGVIYNDTATGKQALFFVDLGGALDLTAKDLEFLVDASAGWFSTGV